MKEVKTGKKMSIREKQRKAKALYDARHVKEIRIAIMMTEFGHYHEQLLSGFKHEMAKLIPRDTKIIYEEFSSQGPYLELISDNFQKIIKRRFDLIYTIGFLQVATVKDLRKQLGNKTPIMFAGIYHAVKKNIVRTYKVSHNALFGVSVSSPSDILPAQLVLISRPDITTFFMPYRAHAMHSILQTELDDMHDYFKECGRHIVMRSYEEHELTSVIEEVKNYPGLIIPEGGMTLLERDMFLQSVKTFEAEGHAIAVFADGKDAIAKGAVYGMRSDVRHLGRLNAQQAKHFFVDRVPAHKIASIELTSPRSLVFNLTSRAVSRHGVTFTRDIVALSQDAIEPGVERKDCFLMLKIFSSYAQRDTPFVRTALGMAIASVKTRLASVYGSESSEPMEEALAGIVARDNQQKLYVSGGHAVQEAAEQIARSGKRLVLESVQVADSFDEAMGLEVRLGTGSYHVGKVFRPLDPGAIMAMMKKCVVRSDKALAIIGLPKHLLPAGIDAYIDRMCQEAKKLKMEGRVLISTDLGEILHFIRKYARSPRNLLFSFPHLIESDLLDSIVDVCREEGILFGVPSLAYKGRAPITFGLADDADQFVVEKRRYLDDGSVIDLISPLSSYTFHVSKRLIPAFGGVLSEKKIKLLPYQFVFADAETEV